MVHKVRAYTTITLMASSDTSPSRKNFLASSFPVYARICGRNDECNQNLQNDNTNMLNQSHYANNHEVLQWFLVQWYQSNWQLVHQLLHYLAPQIQIIAAHKSIHLISLVKHTNIMIGHEFEHRTWDEEKDRSSNTTGWINRKNYLSLGWLCCFLEHGQKFRRLICNSKQ